MTITGMMIKNKGVFLITYIDNSKIVLDFDKMLWDDYEWYLAGEMQQELSIDKTYELLNSNKYGQWKSKRLK